MWVGEGWRALADECHATRKAETVHTEHRSALRHVKADAKG